MAIMTLMDLNFIFVSIFLDTGFNPYENIAPNSIMSITGVMIPNDNPISSISINMGIAIFFMCSVFNL